MSSSDSQAIIILIDNSETSINGDFCPSRLESEKVAVERLIQCFLRLSSKTLIGIGTLAKGEFGIIASLTNHPTKLDRSISSIKRGGMAQLVHGIKCGFLAFHSRCQDIPTHRIIAFIGSQHDLCTEEAASQLAAEANREGVSVDIVAFGDDVNSRKVLKVFTKQLGNKSVYIHANPKDMLADTVLSSPINPRGQDEIVTNDPDLLKILEMSMQNDDIDEELQKVLEQSRTEDEEQDEEFLQELERVKQMSLEDNNNNVNNNDNDKNNGK